MLVASILIVVGAGLFAGWYATRLAVPFVHRALTLAERRLDILEKQGDRSAATRMDPMPPTLMAEAMSAGDEWARQDKLAWMYEQYAALGSWDAVQNVLAHRVS